MPFEIKTAIVGRDSELAEVRSGLHEASSGRGRLFLIEGEPGIGKTSLADQISAEARQGGAIALWGRCWDGGNAPAFWPWVQIFRGIARHTNPQELTNLLSGLALEQIIPDIRETVGIKYESRSLSSADPELARFRSFDSTLDLLRRFARLKSTVITLDDLHAADVTSLLMLRVLARELREIPLLIIGTYRDAERRNVPERSELLADLSREGTNIKLRGLTESEVARFIEVTAKIKATESLVNSLIKTTGGNPFFLTEIVRLLMRDQILASTNRLTLRGLQIPDGIRDSIKRRLAFLPVPAQEVLTIASVIGREFDLNCLSEASQVSLPELVDISDNAAHHGLVTGLDEGLRYAFTHDLIRETIYTEISRGRRIELHRAIAEAIIKSYAPVPDNRMAELAYHSCEALPSGDFHDAILFAQKAAHIAKSKLAYEEAAKLLEMALRVVEIGSPSDEAIKCDLLIDLANALNRAAAFGAAKLASRRALEIAMRLDNAERIARATLELGRRHSDSSIVDWELVKNLENSATKLADKRVSLEAEVLARLAHELYWAGHPKRVAYLSRQAVEIARELDNPAALMATLWSKHESLWAPDNVTERLADATEALRIAESIADWDLALEISYSRIGDLLELGNIELADQEIRNYSRITAQLGGRAIRIEELRAMRVLLEGRFSEAEEFIQKALTEGQRTQRPATLISFAAQISLLRWEQKRMAELEDSIKLLISQYPNLHIARLGLLHSYIQSQHLAEATAELEALAEGEFASISKDFNWLAAMCSLSAAVISLHQRKYAAKLYELLLPYAERNAMMGGNVACYGSVSHYLGMLATLMTRFDDAQRHFEFAVSMHTKMGSTPLLAHTQHEYAAMLDARRGPGDFERAISLNESALTTADLLGMQLLGDKARVLMRNLRTAALSEDSVTSIARLACGRPRSLVMVLFLDIVGSTELAAKMGDRRWRELLGRFYSFVRKELASYHGREVDNAGDGFLAVFNEPAPAIAAGCAIRNIVHQLNLRVRIGLHAGECEWIGEQAVGIAVHIGARVAAKAGADEILVSSTVRDLVSGSEANFTEAGLHVLKGIEGEWRLFRLESPH